MIRLEQVSRRFGAVQAVDSISLSITAGEIFGLVGPDGAGKTTLLRLILGLMTADSGTIQLLGSSTAEAVKDHLGYVPQKFSLYGDLTVMENIRVMGALYGASSAQVAERGREILSFTNLLPFADRLADNLSGGMKQKLALAAGLMHRPQVFFLDEPTTGVDPVSRREFWQMLYRLNKEGVTIVVSTPYMDEAELCSRVAFMNQGRIVACATPAGLKADYPYQLLELSTTVKGVKQLLAGCPLADINAFGERYHLAVKDAAVARIAICQALQDAGAEEYTLQEIPPQLEDVFVCLADQGGAA